MAANTVKQKVKGFKVFSDFLLNIVSLLITENCINCKACETVCPVNAIYPGGKDFELNNKKCRAPEKEHYYIVPGKCNSCKGFYDGPECISICPMDAIKVINKN